MVVDLLELLLSLGTSFGFILIVLFILASAVKIVPEYQRVVVFRVGRLVGAKGPGIVLVIPIIDKVVRVDLRVVTLDVPVQEVITRDNVPIKVNAVVYFRVMDPAFSVVEVENYILATSLLSQTTLRSVVGGADLDEVLSSREKINSELQKIIDERTDSWGIKVSAVELKVPGGAETERGCKTDGAFTHHAPAPLPANAARSQRRRQILHDHLPAAARPGEALYGDVLRQG